MDIYFDNAASTGVREEAIEAMLRCMREDYGNPSSGHRMGSRAAANLSEARKNIADALGTKPETICFTSGGTEANNWAVMGACEPLARKGRHIITSAIEHSAVAEPVKKLENKGWDITYLEPDRSGRIPAEAFSGALRDDTVFASVMLVNNETGALNPVGEYAKAIKQRGLNTVLHTDAVQGFCKIPFTVKSLGADLVAVSSHKLHGPKGAGALYINEGVRVDPLMIGGGHESGRRAGTEPLPAAVGFGIAAKLGASELDETFQAMHRLRDHIITELKRDIPDTMIIGEGDSPYILCLSLPGHKSEVLMNYLSGEGIYVSKSAACKKGARSRTLEAMKLQNAVIDGALRVSFSRCTTLEEAGRFMQVLKTASQTLLKPL